MDMLCFDLEGVLVPEIWIAFSEVSGIPELRRTTRDEPDYNVLMNWRLGILREHHLGIREIQDVISQIDPLPGAKEFFDELRSFAQAVIISDTFKEFAGPLMKKLGYPTLFCNELVIGNDGMIEGYRLRIRDTKLATVRAFQSIGSTPHTGQEEQAGQSACRQIFYSFHRVSSLPGCIGCFTITLAQEVPLFQ